MVDNSGDSVVENANEGIDTVRSSVSWTLGANVENLTLTGAPDITGTGNAGNNIIIGNDGSNALYGMNGNDTLNGGAGNDLLDGGAGNDAMDGGAGNDTYVVDSLSDTVTELAGQGTDTVSTGLTYTLGDNVENLTLTGTEDINGTGNALNNVITGNSGNNVLMGLEGNDTLNGGEGPDTMTGGTGDDIYVVDNTGDIITENADEGTDTVQSAIDYTLGDNLENLTLTGTASINGTGNELNNVITGNSGANILDGGVGADTINAGAGNDILMGGDGNDTLDGGLDADSMTGGTGDDGYVVDNAGDAVIENPDEGTDLVQSSITYALTDNVENLTLTGTADINGTGNELNNVITGNSGANILDGGVGADTINAGAGNDILMGGDGNDTLDGGLDADSMTGGTGDDGYVVDNAGDAVIENPDEGTDLVQSSITYTLGSDVENLSLTGTASINGTGNELNNIITGNSGSNTLYGLEGSDTLNGGAGSDTMLGGTGNDIYIVDNTADIVTENSGEGTDTVQFSVSYTLSANVENLTLTGSASINGTGNDLNNVITGNSGANVIDGGAGADTMLGGGGNDIYVVDDAGDVVTENANEGTDTVQSYISYILGNNLENLTLTGIENIDGTGNALNNVITGNSGANVIDAGAGNDTINAGVGDDILMGGDGDDALNGEAGNDVLSGNSGNDTLNGGLDADSMAGGAGNDTYIVDNAGDVVIENENEGTDTVQSSITYTISDNIENLTLTGTASINGTGSGQDNYITGNSGANVIDGGLGADTMKGGAGNDTYIVDNTGDVVVEAFNSGIDTVQSSVSYTLSTNVENLTLTGTADINGTGNLHNNVLTGNSGSNILDGKAGADSMTGSSGDDTYIVDNAGDVVSENIGEGTDSIQSSVSYTLSANVENLTLTGTGNIDGTGNELDNTITGNTGNNRIDGSAGIDTMQGGAGDDFYVVDNQLDQTIEFAGEGNDTVQASLDWTLSGNVENLILTGSANLNGTGNELNNTLTGNSGNNIINGSAGADSMAGGGGDDIYIVDNTGDTVTESANAGTDIVFSSVSHTLSSNVENMTLTGSADIDATGNELNNILIGNTGNNRLYGMGGNDSLTGNQGHDLLDGGSGTDTMAGNAGNDTYVVDNAGDIVTENVDEEIDTVQSSITYTLGNNVENLTLTGTAAINGTGNSLNNIITGNTGNNILSGLAGNDTLTGSSGNDTLDGGLDADSMAGNAGNDTYIVDNVGDLVTENLNEGTDTVQSSITYTLTSNVENLTLTGTENINGTGNTLNNIITANSGLNTLTGLGGNDTYIVDSTDDVVIENANEGTDTVQSSATYTLSANVENLTLTGTANINGTGNVLNNVITGNSGSNYRWRRRRRYNGRQRRQ